MLFKKTIIVCMSYFLLLLVFFVCLWIVWCLGSTWHFFFSFSLLISRAVNSSWVYACFFFVRHYFRMQLHINLMRKQDDEMFSVLLSPKSSSCRIVSCACVLSFTSSNEHSFFVIFSFGIIRIGDHGFGAPKKRKRFDLQWHATAHHQWEMTWNHWI